MAAHSELPAGHTPAGASEDLQRLKWSHQQLHATGDASESAEGRIGTEFSVEMWLGSRAYLRVEPHFFHQLHTGFQWNQMRYLLNNPLPKVV